VGRNRKGGGGESSRRDEETDRDAEGDDSGDKETCVGEGGGECDMSGKGREVTALIRGRCFTIITLVSM